MSRILALVRPDLGSGFALTGIDVQSVADPSELRRSLSAAIMPPAVETGEGPRYGMVVVEEELMAGLEEEERARFADVVVPLLFEVPGELAWKEVVEGPTEDYVARLIRRAVGYQLNIKL